MEVSKLIQRAVGGDVHAFNELVLRHQQAVYKVAYRILGDPDAAADATQDAFIRAYDKLHTLKNNNFKSWVMRIVSNRCIDELRSPAVKRQQSLDAMTAEFESARVMASAELDPEKHAEQNETMATLLACLHLLPPDQRSVVVLSDVEGYAYAEIAAILEISKGTVKSRLSRARQKLRHCMTSRMELK